jgi:hypothetical protein
MVAGWYLVDVYLRAGVSPAITDTLLATIFGFWNGTTFGMGAADVRAVAGTADKATQLAAALGTGVITANLTQIDGKATSGPPVAIADRPILYLQRLDLHCDAGLAGALQCKNDSATGFGCYQYGGGMGCYQHSTSGYGCYQQGGTADVYLAGSGSIVAAAGEVLNATTVAGKTPAEAGDTMVCAADAMVSDYAKTGEAAAAVATLNDLTQADVRTAVGLAGANLDAQLDALPTASENAAAVAAQATGTAAGSIGKGIADILEDTGTTLPAAIAALPAAIWAVLTSTLTAAGSIGKWLLDTIGAVKTKTDTIGVAAASYTSPIPPDGTPIELVRGDCYSATYGDALGWDISDYAVTESMVATLTIRDRATDEVLTTATSAVDAALAVSFDLTSAQTALLTLGTNSCKFDVEVTLTTGAYKTVASGYVTVSEDQTRH